MKMMSVDTKSSTYIKFGVENKNPEFKVGDLVRKSKHKKYFANGYTLNSSAEVFMIREDKNTALWIYLIEDLNGEDFVGKLYEKQLQKTNKVEKVIKRIGEKLCVK